MDELETQRLLYERAELARQIREQERAAKEAEESNSVRAHLARLAADAQSRIADCPSSAQLEQEAREAAERERLTLWHGRFLAKAPVRGTERAWRPEPTFAMRAVRSWLAAGATLHLMLRGGVGTGKSTAAARAIRYWTEDPVKRGSCAWMRPDEMVSAVQHSYDPSAPRLARNIVVDDIGRETKADFEEAFCYLLEKRGHTLVMTTNLTEAEMRKRYDKRVIDRLLDTTLAVDVPGDSMRKGEGF